MKIAPFQEKFSGFIKYSHWFFALGLIGLMYNLFVVFDFVLFLMVCTTLLIGAFGYTVNEVREAEKTVEKIQSDAIDSRNDIHIEVEKNE
jgi:hypothetical protein